MRHALTQPMPARQPARPPLRSHRAFRNQANRCTMPAQTCLASQIYDLQQADLDRISQGLDPRYLITRYGTGDDNPRQVQPQGATLLWAVCSLWALTHGRPWRQQMAGFAWLRMASATGALAACTV